MLQTCSTRPKKIEKKTATVTTVPNSSFSRIAFIVGAKSLFLRKPCGISKESKNWVQVSQFGASSMHVFTQIKNLFLFQNEHSWPPEKFLLCSYGGTYSTSNAESHLWYVLPEEVKSKTLLNKYFEILSPCEKQNVLQMRNDELQKSALLARALVRTTVSRYTNNRVDPRSLNFRKNDFGKPEVEWQISDDWQPPALHFNISHTSSLIACGVTVDSPIGIDVEDKQRKLKHHILAFARRYFSCHEVEHLTSISNLEIQRQQFIKLWTLKEAYVKALGRGFSAAPFKTFTIRLKAAAKRGTYLSGDTDSEISEISVDSLGSMNLTNNWQFRLLELAGSHYAAICMEKQNTIKGKGNDPLKLTVRRTIPFVEDECVLGTDVVVPIGGITC